MFFKRSRGTKIFFATDIHGAEVCFRKFLNAAKFYKADAIIHGGDLTGKAIVPLVQTSNGCFSYELMGKRYETATEAEVVDAERLISINGFYPCRLSREKAEYFDSHPDAVHQLFEQVVRQSVLAWVDMAEEKLRGTGVKCFVLPGNDDFQFVSDLLKQSAAVSNPEGTVVWLDDEHELVSTGYSNPTPWNAPRELPEDQLAKHIESMMVHVTRPDQLVLSIHVPPYGQRIDDAPMLKDFQVQSELGQPKMVPVGSTAVLEVIQKYQPLVSLHGHIHESRGAVRIGRTLAINPGSSYNDGVVTGVLVTVEGAKVAGHQFVSG